MTMSYIFSSNHKEKRSSFYRHIYCFRVRQLLRQEEDDDNDRTNYDASGRRKRPCIGVAFDLRFPHLTANCSWLGAATALTLARDCSSIHSHSKLQRCSLCLETAAALTPWDSSCTHSLRQRQPSAYLEAAALTLPRGNSSTRSCFYQESAEWVNSAQVSLSRGEFEVHIKAAGSAALPFLVIVAIIFNECSKSG